MIHLRAAERVYLHCMYYLRSLVPTTVPTYLPSTYYLRTTVPSTYIVPVLTYVNYLRTIVATQIDHSVLGCDFVVSQSIFSDSKYPELTN